MRRFKWCWVRVLAVMVTACLCLHNLRITLRLEEQQDKRDTSNRNPLGHQGVRVAGRVMRGVYFNPASETPTSKHIPKTESLSSDEHNFTVITAANRHFYKALVNFVGSLHYWEPSANLVIYDLGFLDSQRQFIRTWCRAQLVTFNFTLYPSHFAALDRFAWKPVIIREAVLRFGVVLWSDAGSDIRGPLDKIREYLHRDRYFFVQGQDTDMVQTCNKQMFEYLKQNISKFSGKYSFAGGLHGWVKDGPAFHKILQPWVRCAADVNCISPPGASLYDHRFDQSALSILAYSSGINITAHTELLAAQRGQLNHDKTRASDMVIHTARGRNRDYMEYICYDVSRWEREREGQHLKF